MSIMVHGECECPLCGRPFGGDRVLNFTFVGLADPRFAILDDYAVHAECLEKWRLRDEFIAVWNAEAKRHLAPVWMLEVNKYGNLQFSKECAWKLGFERLLILAAPIYWVGNIFYRFGCKLLNFDPVSGRKLGPKCKNCGNRLFTADARQCLKCGMDWHNPQSVVFHNTRTARPVSDTQMSEK